MVYAHTLTLRQSLSYRFGLSILTIFFLIIYVAKMSSVSIRGYEISSLEGQIRLLEQGNQQMEIDIARLSTMAYIQEKVKELQFVPIGNPEFLNFHNSSVARR